MLAQNSQCDYFPGQARRFARGSKAKALLPLGLVILLFGLLLNDANANAKTEATALYSTVLKSMGQAIIIPHHQRLHDDITVMDKSIDSLCNEPSNDALIAVQNAWRRAMSTWSGLSVVDFGPIDSLNALWKFQFWPDPLNLVHRKFKSRLSGRISTNTADDLANASVAIQGLSAVEYLLFDPALDPLRNTARQPQFCAILKNTSLNLQQYAVLLNDRWANNYGDRWHSKIIDQQRSGFLKQNFEKLFSSVVATLEASVELKLAKPLGLSKVIQSPEKIDFIEMPQPNPWRLESWRSKNSLQNLQSNLEFLHEMYSHERGLGWLLVELSNKNKKLDRKIRRKFDQVFSAMASFEEPLFVTIEQGDFDEIRALMRTLIELHFLIKNRYAEATDITFRFNSLDGD
jgi:predicted lipoprotein